MRNPEFSNSSANQAENSAEALRQTEQERGHKTYEAVAAERERLLKRKAELEARLKAAGVQLEPVEPTAKPAESAENVPVENVSAESIPDLTAAPAPESPDLDVPRDTSEQESTAEVSPAELAGKAKKNPALRKYITGLLIGVAAAITIPTAANAIGGGFLTNAPQNNVQTEQEAGINVVTFGAETAVETESGITDGYNKDGMWLSDSKPNSVAFADFNKVVKNFNGNTKEALKYTADNEVEALSDYIAAIPDNVLATLPQDSELIKFKGLSEQKVNDQIENMLSDEAYDKLKQEFNNLIDKAKVKDVILHGRYSNAYMAVRNSHGTLIGAKAAREAGISVNHENMKLVVCHTSERGTKAYEYTWTDDSGKVLGSITVKGPCAQAVEKEGTSTRFDGLAVAVETSLSGGGPITIIKEKDKDKDDDKDKDKDKDKDDDDDDDKDPDPEPEDDENPEPEPEDDDTPEPEPEDDDEPGPHPDDDDTPEEDKSKDEDNMRRIDDNIADDIADDIGTDEVIVTPTDDVHDEEESTDKPSGDDYQGTEAETEQNDASEEAESIQDQVSDANDYSGDQGGANADNAADHPVEDNQDAQDEADSKEMSQEEAPSSGESLDEALSDLGIE